MSTKTWTSTADFASATINTILDDAIITRHQGNADGAGFSADNMPDTNGETLSGWTQWWNEADAPTSGVTFSDGVMQMTVKCENNASKQMFYIRETTSTITKSSTFSTGGKLKYVTSDSVSGMWGLFNISNPGGANQIRLNLNAENAIFQVVNSAGTSYTDSQASAVSEGETFWWLIRGDGTNITADVYSTEELYNAASTGDVAALSIAVSGIAGTVSCTNFGFRNNADTSTDYQVFDVYFFDGDVCNWYDDAQADTTAVEWSAPTTVDYSSFTYSVTGTATILFDLHKKETVSGTYTTYDNSSAHYELSAITALSDENLYGFKVTAYIDVSGTYAAITDIAVDNLADTTAPTNLDYLKVHRPTDTDWWVVAYVDAVDAVNFSHNELRISEDAGSTWSEFEWDSTNKQFVMTATASTSLKLLNPNTTGTADYYGYAFVLDKSDLGITATDIKIQMRGVDTVGNNGGWTTADNYGATDGTTYVTSNITECLRAIANRS